MSLGFDPARKTVFSPSSLATAVNQAIGNLLISSIDSKLPTLVNGALPVIIAPPGTNGQIAYNDNGIFAGLSLGAGLSIVGGVLTVSGGGGGGGGSGTVTSVGLGAPTGFSVAGSPVTGAGSLTLEYAAGYSLPTTASQANWNTAYSERSQWDGSATGLVAATGRASLGLGTAATTDSTAYSAAVHGHSWSQIGSTPTTLSGYGITDGLTSATAATTYSPIVHGHSASQVGAAGTTGQLTYNNAGVMAGATVGSGLSLTAGVLTATGGGGGGSPGGSTTQVQYNNAGVFAGATNVEINSNNLQLTAPSSTPAAAEASSVVVYPVGLADRFMLAMRGPTGAAMLLQPSLFSNNIMLFSPQSGTTGTGSSSFQTAWTSNGTVTHPAPDATSVATSGRRTTYTNVTATTNQALGARMNTDAERCFFRGNVANTGGFFLFWRFRLTYPASTTRLFAGLQGISASAALISSDTPSGPYCGIAHATTDPATGSGALNFVTHDGTTRNALPINLASNLVTGSPLLEFSMHCEPNGGTIFFRLDDVTNGTTYTNSTTTNLPGATVMMSPQCMASNGTANVTVGTVAVSVYKGYIESVY